jgi:hydrogenase maturation protein HypF
MKFLVMWRIEIALMSRGVVIEVEGAQDRLYEFIGKLQSEAPPLAAIERIESLAIPLAGDGQFEINESDGAGDRDVLIAPDIATCDDCEREIFTPSDRLFATRSTTAPTAARASQL